jgi:hypothetical protein
MYWRGAVLFAGSAAAAAVALLLAGAVLGDNAMHVRRVKDARPNELPGGAELRDTGPAEAPQGILPNELHLRQIIVNAGDGTKLSGLFLPAGRTGSRRCAIALHGIGDRGSNALWLGRMLAGAGYSALLADSRAHGESGGELATYGVLVKHDVSAWINNL